MKPSSEYTLAELAEQSQTPARTIRFYIARGLLEGPSRAGRGAYYTDAHLERIARIRKLQLEGRMLAEIAMELNGGEAAAPAPEAWWAYEVSSDVRVMVRDGGSPWRMRLIRTALAELTLRLRAGRSEEGGNDGGGNKE